MTRPDAMQEFDATSGGTFGRETSNAENWPAPVVAIEEARRQEDEIWRAAEASGGNDDPHVGGFVAGAEWAIERSAEALRAATARADAAEATVAAVTKYASEWKRRAERYEKALTSLQNRTAYAMPWQHPEVNDFVRGALSATEGNNILDTVVPLL